MQIKRKLLLVIFVATVAGDRPNFQQREISQPKAPYDFGYGVSVPDTGDAKEHKESVSSSGNTEGEYRVLEPSGLYRVTRYRVNGGSGFRATVTLEPGDHIRNYKYQTFTNPSATASSTRGTSFSSAGKRGHGAFDSSSGQLFTRSSASREANSQESSQFQGSQNLASEKLQQLQGFKVSRSRPSLTSQSPSSHSFFTQRALDSNSQTRKFQSQESDSDESFSSKKVFSQNSRSFNRENTSRQPINGVRRSNQFLSQSFSGSQRFSGKNSHGSQIFNSQGSRGSQGSRAQPFHASLASQRQVSHSFQRFSNKADREFQNANSQDIQKSLRFPDQVSPQLRKSQSQVNIRPQLSQDQVTRGSLRSRGQVIHGSQFPQSSQRLRSQSFNNFQSFRSQSSLGSQNEKLRSFQRPNAQISKIISRSKNPRDNFRQSFPSLKSSPAQSSRQSFPQISKSQQTPRSFQEVTKPLLSSHPQTNTHSGEFRDSREESFQSHSQSPLRSTRQNIFGSQNLQDSLESRDQRLSHSSLLEKVQELGFISSPETQSPRLNTQSIRDQASGLQRKINQRFSINKSQGQTSGLQRISSQRINTKANGGTFSIHTSDNQQKNNRLKTQTRSQTGATHIIQNRGVGTQSAQSRGFKIQKEDNQSLGTKNFASQKDDEARRFSTQRGQQQRTAVDVPVHDIAPQSFPLSRSQGQFLGASQIGSKNFVIQNTGVRDLLESDESESSPESSSEESEDGDSSSQESPDEEGSIEDLREDKSGENFEDGQSGAEDNNENADENLSTRGFQDDDATVQEQVFGSRLLPNLRSGFNVQAHQGQRTKTQQAPQFRRFQIQEFETKPVQGQKFGVRSSHQQDTRVQGTRHFGVSTNFGF